VPVLGRWTLIVTGPAFGEQVKGSLKELFSLRLLTGRVMVPLEVLF
jgi:hypothetical protein